MASPANLSSCCDVRCGIVLAAGDGVRLREFVRRLRGDDLPKQYVNFVGKRSMLEHTFQRAEMLIPAQRLFTVVAREHLDFADVRRQLASRPRQAVLVQPYNRDTAAGILLPLMYLYKQYPEAVAAIFPSDHFVLEEDRFMRYVELGFEIAQRDSAKIVLLGVEPDCPDTELGYIVPGPEIEPSRLDSARTVEMFVEKPSSRAVAEKIIKTGALWNTFVMIVKAKTLLDLFERATPQLFRSFQPILNAIGTPVAAQEAERIYQGLTDVNFSKGVLEALPFELRGSLSVLRVRGVTWYDWGTSTRLLQTLEPRSTGSSIQPGPVRAGKKTANGRLSFEERIPGPVKRVR